MRRIAKISLLLAPLMLASISGCATPRWMSRSEPTDPRVARVNRLLAVAAEYEAEGKPDAAMRVYEHVIAQQPENAAAVQRRDLLAQQGVKSGGRALKPQIGAAAAHQELLASAQKAKMQPAADEKADLAGEIHRKNAELARMLTQQKTQAQPLMVMPGDGVNKDSGLEPTPAPEVSIAAKTKTDLQKILNDQSNVEDPGWTSAVSGSGWNVVSEETSKPAVAQKKEEKKAAEPSVADLAAAEKKVAANPAAEDGFKPTVASSDVDWAAHTPAKAEVKAAVVEEDSGWTVAERKADKNADKEEKIETVSLSQETKPDSWTTTDLVRKVEEKSQAVSPTAEEWSSTRLVGLCENLSPELIPLVEKLESKNATDRIGALLELGEMKAHARSASVAVYALMEDRDAIVAVYAAGTLRQITGDAWSAVHTLASYLKHSDPGVVQLSAYLLGQIGPEAMDAVPALERVKDEASSLTSLHAAEALTRIAPGNVSAVDKLTSALNEADRELRWFAAVSLGSISGECEKQAAEALKKALQDGEEDVRIAACLSLGGLGPQASIAIPELESAARSDNAEVKSAAETALACLRG